MYTCMADNHPALLLQVWISLRQTHLLMKACLVEVKPSNLNPMTTLTSWLIILNETLEDALAVFAVLNKKVRVIVLLQGTQKSLIKDGLKEQFKGSRGSHCHEAQLHGCA